ncbi:esterase E4-like [Panulirus ornatus]|uniref:esterase E4-like n=1 Tax=Panulirus ornatus TaxID=150431 RepID=UPI003A8B3037
MAAGGADGGGCWRTASVFLMVMMTTAVVVVMGGQDYDALPTDLPTSMIARLTDNKGDGYSEEVTHTTPKGTITGLKEVTVGTHPTNTHYYGFRGIPYAEPPVGSLRWADPVDHVGKWAGRHLNATRYQSFCPQYDTEGRRTLGNEDCLYLNIFTPYLPGSPESKTRAAPLPVFVFIHGGAYLRGSSSSHGPARLLTHDIVLVTLNYRLGALGFLTTNDPSLPGNYGLLDQVSALRWVQANVAHFGGDPTRVTIGGFSAGASSVHMHMVSPLSRGLFHQSIMMSGSAHCLWAVQKRLKDYAHMLAKNLDCPVSPSAALKSCLLDIPTNELVSAQADMHTFEFWPLPFTAVVDVGLRENPLLPAPVSELQPTRVPVLMGSVPNESLIFSGVVVLMAKEPKNTTLIYQEAVPYIFALWPEMESVQTVKQLTEAFYFTDQAKTSLDTFLEQSTESLTDYMFTMCVWDTADSLARDGLPVYTYLYNHREADTPIWATPIYKRLEQLGARTPLLTKGISHGDDLVLLFNFQHAPGMLPKRDQTVSDLLTSMWTNFIATGKPQESKGSMSELPRWTPVEPGVSVGYYNITVTPSMVYTPFKQKERNFWQKVLPKATTLRTSLLTHNSAQCVKDY